MKPRAVREDLDRQAEDSLLIRIEAATGGHGGYYQDLRGRPSQPNLHLRNSKEVNDSTIRRSKYLALTLAILFVTSTAFGWTQSAPATVRALSATEQHLLDSISVATI